MVKPAALLLLSVWCTGCMYDARSVGPSNGLVQGEGGAAGGGVVAPGGGGGVGGAGSAGAAGSPGDEVFGPACTPGTERTDCPGTSCDPATGRCSSFKRASRSACWTCVSDSDCEDPDHRCVEMYFDGERFPDDKHGFCLQVALVDPPLEPGTNDDDDDDADSNCVEPFEILLINRPSLSGLPTDSYCGLWEDLTTCFALRAFENQEACPDGTDEECPMGGICRTFGHGTNAVNCCTFECTDDDECPLTDDAEPSCDGYCGG